MTFTKETPTKAGYYLWRKGLDGEVTEVCAIRKDKHGDLVASFESGFRLILPINGDWCRLVPAEEIKLAWREGASISDVFAWPESRAMRVMEGDL